MSEQRFPPARPVPTLTEVVAHGDDETVDEAPGELVVVAEEDPSQLAARVLGDLQRQIDVLLEQRLREMLAPALARFADGLVAESREQIAVALREVVERAVAQELERQRRR